MYNVDSWRKKELLLCPESISAARQDPVYSQSSLCSLSLSVSVSGVLADTIRYKLVMMSKQLV